MKNSQLITHNFHPPAFSVTRREERGRREERRTVERSRGEIRVQNYGEKEWREEREGIGEKGGETERRSWLSMFSFFDVYLSIFNPLVRLTVSRSQWRRRKMTKQQWRV